MGCARITSALLFAAVVSCSLATAQTYGVPFVNQALSPASAAPKSPGFTLTVTGTGFAPTAVVNWNRSPRVTEAISSTELKASINAADVAKAQTAWITVTNPAPGGGTSNVVFFPVRKPASAIAMAGIQAFQTSTLAVGDFNNDGKLDVVWVDSSGNLNVSFGKGDGTFKPPIQNRPANGLPSQIIAGDFNGDGNLDVVTIEVGGKVAVFYAGDGQGHLTPYQQVYGWNGIYFLGAAPFGLNGPLGLYYTDTNTGHQWFVAGGFEYYEWFAGGFSQAAIGDFNGDGILDLANPTVFLGSSDGSFQPFGSADVGGYSSVVADMNNDGRLDIVQNGCVWLGNGDGTFSLAPCSYSNVPTAGVGDFNGDGILDAAVDHWGQGGVILLGAGDGTFSKVFSFPGGTGSETYVGAIGDFNNDGMLDVLLGSGFLLLQTTAGLSPTSLSFGNQYVGTTSEPQTATLVNVGRSALVIKSIGITGSGSADFLQTNNCGSKLRAGASCTITVTFQPQAAATFSASVSVSYKGVGSPQTVALSGTGVTPPTVSLLPSQLQYPSQLVGTTSSTQTVTLTNTGDLTVAISSITVSSMFSQTNNCPANLAVGTSCTIQVAFQPTAPGVISGTLTVSDNAQGSPQTVSLSGIATTLTFSPEGINFGNQKVGTKSVAVPVTMTNVGSVPVTGISITFTGTNPSDFSQTNNCGNSLAGNSSCTINVVFQPTATGARSATLSVSVAGGGNPAGVPLAGTGT